MGENFVKRMRENFVASMGEKRWMKKVSVKIFLKNIGEKRSVKKYG